MPDGVFSYGGQQYGFPGLIIAVGDSQRWEGKEGVKNKAIYYEDESEGKVTGVLYLSYRDRSIGMIGSKTIFPDCPRVKYLDGTPSTYTVEVIPLTSLTDPVYSECLLPLKFVYCGAKQVLRRSLKPAEQDMGFFFTFKQILQMIEMVSKEVSSSPPEDRFDPHNSLKTKRTWDLATAVQASLFTTPPELLPYAPAQADEDDPVEDSSSDEDVDVEEKLSPTKWPAHKRMDHEPASPCLRRSGRFT